MTRPAAVLSAMLVTVLLAAAPSAQAATKRVPFQRSITLAEWGPTAYDPARTRAVLKRLKERQHVDTVTLLVVWTQAGETSTDVRPGSVTTPEARVRGAIRAARKLRLRVVLRPYIDRDDRGWRGDLHPESVPAWFASYGRFILRYASIARREKVSGFVVGSEMTTLSDEEGSWRDLVGAVRQRFGGWVAYQANWGGEESNITWWDAVDVISLSAYYPIAARPGLSAAQLAEGWKSLIDEYGQEQHWYARIEALKKRWGRPVMFGEIGYRPVPETAVEPWNTQLTGSDDRVQPAAYDAALRVWYRVPWFRGMHWWYVTPNDDALNGRLGADHRPGPAALRTISRWYRRPPR